MEYVQGSNVGKVEHRAANRADGHVSKGSAAGVSRRGCVPMSACGFWFWPKSGQNSFVDLRRIGDDLLERLPAKVGNASPVESPTMEIVV